MINLIKRYFFLTKLQREIVEGLFTLASDYIIDSLSKSESVKFSQIESVICLFTDSPVKKYISL